jgi:hypothetical protein
LPKQRTAPIIEKMMPQPNAAICTRAAKPGTPQKETSTSQIVRLFLVLDIKRPPRWLCPCSQSRFSATLTPYGVIEFVDPRPRCEGTSDKDPRRSGRSS